MKISGRLSTLIFIPMFFFFGLSQADNVMKIKSAHTNSNQIVEVEITIENDSSFVAFQVDIPMHDEFAFLQDSIFLNPTRSNANHILSDTILPGDTLRILGYSTNNTTFTGDTGVIVSFKLQAGSDPGDYLFQLIDPIIGSVSSNNVLTSSVNGTITIKAPDIFFNMSQIDFGETPLTDSTDRSVTFYNQGNLPLDISSVTFGNPYFSLTSATNFIVDAGSNISKTIRFQSVLKGDYEIDMIVSSNDPDEGTSTVKMIANAFAVNEIHTGNMFAYSGDTARLTFTLNNMEPFNGFQFDLNMPAPLRFMQDSIRLSTRKTDHIVSANVLSNNKLRVVAYSATNQFFTGCNGAVVSLDFYVEGIGGYYSLNLNNVLIGDSNGMNSLSEYYNGQLQIAAADISCNSSLAFGDVSILGTDTKTLTIDNTGNDTLEITGLNFTNTSYNHYETLPISINPGFSEQISITFMKVTEGNANGTLKIYSNDPDESPKSVDLTAFAFVPNYLSVKDTSFIVGDTIYVDILVENVENFVGFQVELQTPLIMQCVLDSVGLTNRQTDHIIQASFVDTATNKIRIFAYSLSQSNFTGYEGSIARIPFVLDSLVAGIYNIDITDAILGDNQSEDILYSFSDGQATGVDGVPGYTTVRNIIINAGDTVCYNATNTITIAGDGTTVVVQSGGSATFISGYKILFKPGFNARPGCYTSAYITSGDFYCNELNRTVVNPDNDEIFPIQEIADEDPGIRIYPNPCRGDFIIDFMNKELTGEINLLNIHGRRLFQCSFLKHNKVIADISHLPDGLYLVLLKTSEAYYSKKVIKN